MKTFSEYCNLLNSSLFSVEEEKIELLITSLIKAWETRNVVYLCGNGGSAGNANHLANDLTFGSTYPHEIGISVESLASNASVLTCLANDLGYEYVFSHQLKVKASKGDVLLAFSGSGNSSNIVEALKTAKQMGVLSFCFLGYTGGICKDIADIPIHVNINDMQISEDMQTIILHYIIQRINHYVKNLNKTISIS